MIVTHPAFLEILVPADRARTSRAGTVSHPLDYVARRRFPVRRAGWMHR